MSVTSRVQEYQVGNEEVAKDHRTEEVLHNIHLAYEKNEFDNAFEHYPLIDLPLDWQQSEETGGINRTVVITFRN